MNEIAEQQDWSLSEVIRRAAEHIVDRFPGRVGPIDEWQFPTLDCGGDFLLDPALVNCEADAIEGRG